MSPQNKIIDLQEPPSSEIPLKGIQGQDNCPSAVAFSLSYASEASGSQNTNCLTPP